MVTILSLIAAILIGQGARAADPYNEAYAANGDLRPAFQEYARRTKLHPLQPPPGAANRLTSRAPLGDSNRIFPVPLLLSKDEYERVIVRGTKQLIRAYLHLFWDVVKNPVPKIVQAGHVSEAFITQVFAEAGLSLDLVRTLWEGQDEQELAVQAGLDLTRAPNGELLVSEVNFGNIGGLFESLALREAFQKAVFSPSGLSLAELFGETDVDPYRELFHYLGQHWGVKSDGSDTLVIIDGADDTTPSFSRHFDQEHSRQVLGLAHSLTDLTIISPPSFQSWNLLLDAKPWKAVIQLGANMDFFKAFSFAMKCVERRIKLMRSLGTDALENKALLPFVEQFIRFYLGERPILRTIPTRLVDRSGGFDFAVDRVYKKGTSMQGRDVLLGPKLADREIAGAKKAIVDSESLAMDEEEASFPALWVEQPFITGSVISPPGAEAWAAYQVDVRPLAWGIGLNHVEVATLPWGRATSVLGHGKTNVSLGAMELLVLPIECGPQLVVYGAS